MTDNASNIENGENGIKIIESDDNITAGSPSIENEEEIPSNLLRLALESFYKRYNPEKLGTLDTILERFKGKEEQLVQQLQQKYGGVAEASLFSALTDAIPKAIKIEDIKEKEQVEVKQTTQTNVTSNTPTPSLGSSTISAAASFLTGMTGVGFLKQSGSTVSNMTQSIPTIIKKENELDTSLHSGTTPTPLSNTISTVLADKVTPPSPMPNVIVEESTWITRISVLQAELRAKDEEKIQLQNTLKQAQHQISKFQKEKSKQTIDTQELTQKVESLQRNLSAALDREVNYTKEIQTLQEQNKMLEKINQENSQQIAVITTQKHNKHNQLCDIIQINHRLSAQLRFIVSKFLESNPSYDELLNRAHLACTHSASEPSNSNTGSIVTGKERVNDISGIGEEGSVLAEVSEEAQTAQSSNDSPVVVNSTDLATQTLTSSPVPTLVDSGETQLSPSQSSQQKSSIRGGVDGVSSVDENTKSGGARQNQRVIELEGNLFVSESSLQASRLELQIAMTEKYKAEKALAEQGNLLEALQKKLNGILNELETASGSADSMKRQVATVSADLNVCRDQLLETQKKLVESARDVEEKRMEIDKLKFELQGQDLIKKQIAKLYTDHSRNTEEKALRIVAELSERLIMEREEYLSKLAVISSYENEAKLAEDDAIQAELLKLREELFKSRRAEAQKDRELVFMQRQLCDAAGKIARMMEEAPVAVMPISDKSLKPQLGIGVPKSRKK